ncbi:Eugenol synthase 1, partial [Fusarium oxysporum f. sp. albedinis]
MYIRHGIISPRLTFWFLDLNYVDSSLDAPSSPQVEAISAALRRVCFIGQEQKRKVINLVEDTRLSASAF